MAAPAGRHRGAGLRDEGAQRLGLGPRVAVGEVMPGAAGALGRTIEGVQATEQPAERAQAAGGDDRRPALLRGTGVTYVVTSSGWPSSSETG